MTVDKKLVADVQKMLDEDRLYAEVYPYLDLPVIAIHIEWGDWKHEHWRCDWLIEEKFPQLHKVNVKVTEEDGSDCYSGTHYYVVSQ